MKSKCGALPVVDNFVAWDWEEQITMLKTASKSVQKWRRYNRLKFGALITQANLTARQTRHAVT